MDKAALLQAIVARLEAEFARQTAAAEASRAEATDPDSRAEGKFDMRGQSAGYLAAGQGRLAAEIAEAVAAYRALPARAFGPLEAAAVGAVVTLEAPGGRSRYFLGPAGGGLDLELGGVPVTVVTAGSLLGRSLVGRRTGESVALPGRAPAARPTVVAIE